MTRFYTYGGSPNPDKRWIRTVWPLRRGDTYTTVVADKPTIYKVVGFYHCLTEGRCPQLHKLREF